jgi:prevent-host-death family protein
MTARPRREVGSRELKTRLGTYLREVQGGQVIVVTERGRPVAELRPLGRDAARAEDEAALWRRLAADGVIGHIPEQGGRLEEFDPVASTQPVSAAIVDDREDRA